MSTPSLFASFKIEPLDREEEEEEEEEEEVLPRVFSRKNRKKKAGRHHIIVSSIEKRIARIKTSFEKFQKHPASSGNQSSSPGEKTTKCARTTSTRSSRRNR